MLLLFRIAFSKRRATFSPREEQSAWYRGSDLINPGDRYSCNPNGFFAACPAYVRTNTNRKHNFQAINRIEGASRFPTAFQLNFRSFTKSPQKTKRCCVEPAAGPVRQAGFWWRGWRDREALSSGSMLCNLSPHSLRLRSTVLSVKHL